MKETRLKLTDDQRARVLAGETVEIYKPEESGRVMLTEREEVIVITEFSATEPPLTDDLHFQHWVCVECLTAWETPSKSLEVHNPLCPRTLRYRATEPMPDSASSPEP